MLQSDPTPGQSIDPLKSEVIIPTVADLATTALGTRVDPINYLEIGPGDGTSMAQTIKLLEEKGLQTDRVTAVESDEGILPDLLGTVTAKSFTRKVVAVINTAASILGLELEDYEKTYDLVNLQMVLHQVLNPDLRSLLFAKIFMALKPGGAMIVTELAPMFLSYLTVEEPGKFIEYPGGAMGKYFFDNGTTQEIAILKLLDIRMMALDCGLVVEDRVIHDLTPVAKPDTRYSRLMSTNVPMVYSMVIRKQSDRFLAYSEGRISKIEKDGKYVEVTFLDGSSRSIPGDFTPSWEVGDKIVIQQLSRLMDKTCVVSNVWLYPEDHPEKVKRYGSAAKVIS